MGKKRKAPKLVVYNLLLKEVSAQNKLLPEEKKLSVAERREFIKKKLWPEYSKIPRYKIRLWELREIIYRKFKRLPKKTGCDVTLLDPDQYSEIDYYEIDDRLRVVMPQCIYVKVNAGEFGETKIFNTRDYNYETTGVGRITRNINDWVDKLPVKRRKSAYIIYNGIVLLRGKRPNDGTPENYYLEFDLFINDKPQVVQQKGVEIPKKKKRKRSRREMTKNKMRSYINSRIKALRTEKSIFKKIRVAIANAYHDTKKIYAQPKSVLSDDDKKRIKKNQINRVVKLLDRHLKNGKINQKYYDKYRKEVNKEFSKFSNRKSGSKQKPKAKIKTKSKNRRKKK